MIIGILLDLLGRRAIIPSNLLIFALALAYTPFAYPSQLMLYADLVLNEVLMATLESSPLIVDYAPR